jgi:hypothetical protein
MMAAAKRNRFIGFIYVLPRLKIALRLRNFSAIQTGPGALKAKIKGGTLPQEKASGKSALRTSFPGM